MSLIEIWLLSLVGLCCLIISIPDLRPLSYFVDEDHSKLSTLYRLLKLCEIPYQTHFIAISSSCTTTELSIISLSPHCDKNHVIKYCETIYERNGKNIFRSI